MMFDKILERGNKSKGIEERGNLGKDRYFETEEIEREVEKSRYAKDLKEIIVKSRDIYKGNRVTNTKNGLELL